MTGAQMLITNLPFDLLKLIVLIVVQSSDGAEYLAKAIAVCKVFLNISEDKDILKAVVFDNVRLSGRYGLFQQINGLVNRCAHAGNVTAQYLLAKVIMFSSSQLLNLRNLHASSSCQLLDSRHQFSAAEGSGANNSLASSFMAYFTGERSSCCRVSGETLCHYLVVKFFLCRSRPSDIIEMGLDFIHYILYTKGHEENRTLELLDIMNNMYPYARYIQFFGMLQTKNIETLEEIDTGVAVWEELNGRFDNLRYFEFQVLKSRVYARMTKVVTEEIDDINIQLFYLEYNKYIEELKKLCVGPESMGRVAPVEMLWFVERVCELRVAGVELRCPFEAIRGQAMSAFDRLFGTGI